MTTNSYSPGERLLETGENPIDESPPSLVAANPNTGNRVTYASCGKGEGVDEGGAGYPHTHTHSHTM